MHILPAEDVHSLVNYTSKIRKQMESCFTAKKLLKKKKKKKKEGKKETMRNPSPYQCIMDYTGIKVPWNKGLFVYMKLSDTTWEKSDIPVIVHKARF